MHTIVEGILKHNKSIVIMFLLLALICAVMFLGVSVNYNMVDYLPDEAVSTVALEVMEAEFDGSIPNARVMLNHVTVAEALAFKERLKAVDGVSDVLWLDDIIDIKEPLAMAATDVVEEYYKEGSALFSITVADSRERQIIDELYDLIGEDGAVAGDAAGTATYQRLSVTETVRAVALLMPIILLILLLTTTSWLEPLLFLAAIGVAVLLNMGTNLFFGEVSFITNSISPILQLAVSLDYAIFLLHSFGKYRQETGDVRQAMGLAVKQASRVVVASAMTTFFGFIVLIFMDFKIGSDLGLILGKGILFSLISVLVFLPALTVWCYKWIDKTRHRPLFPSLQNRGRFFVRARVPMLILVIVLVVPAFLAQQNNEFTYGTGDMDPSARVGQDEIAIVERFGDATPMVLLVPRGDVAKERILLADLEAIEDVTSVVTYVNTVGAEIPSEFLPDEVVSQFYSDHYCRFILYADTPAEGAKAFAVVEQVRAQAAEQYGEEALSCGLAANLYDMRDVVSSDNSRVNLLAILAIGLVILVAFRSLTLPIILLLTIEAAIWINLAIPYFTGSVINYIGFLVINTVQLGATVDYAILFTSHYMGNRRLMLKKEAAIATVGDTMRSILVSGVILASTGFMIGVVSTNAIVSELGALLGRGTLLSMTMVFVFLPALLTIFDKVIQKTTWLKEPFRNQ